MPIPFPPRSRDSILIRRQLVGASVLPPAVLVPNLASPGFPFDDDKLNMGTARRLLTPLVPVFDPATTSQPSMDRIQDPSNRRVFERTLADTRNVISGTSYDSAGTVLPLATVLVFSTSTNEFLGQTTSDANGLWSFAVTRGWPLFLVEYKAGTPDVAGTSVNTIIPTIT